MPRIGLGLGLGLQRGGGAPADPNAIAGDASLTFTAAGVLTALGALAGSAGLAFTPAGLLVGKGALSGNANLTFAPAGTLTALGSLTGNSTLTFSASGSLTSGAWSPASITTALWLDADDAATLTPNGSTLQQWNDKSGNARHFSQTGVPARQPTIVAAGMNGRTVIRFSAASITNLVGPSFTALTAGHAFIVFKRTADPAASTASAGLWCFGSHTTGSVVPFTDGVIYDQFGTTVRKTTVNPAASLTSPRVYEVVSTSTEWSNHLDGTQLFTTATNTVGWNTATNVGWAGSGNSSYMDGDIAELIICPAKLGTTDRAAMKSYLNTKWGTTAV